MTDKAKELGSITITPRNRQSIDPNTGKMRTYSYGGITKREYFAGLMMQALLSNPERYKYISEQVQSGNLTNLEASNKNAHKAVLLADALLEELSKTERNGMI